MAKKMSKKVTKKNDHLSDEFCFLIMPFGGPEDEYVDAIYRPAVKAAGLDLRRADDIFLPHMVMDRIWEMTRKSRLMLAVLTEKNANVFYELGLAHAIKKPVILVATSMDDVPFDLRHLGIILYDKNDPEWGRNLRKRISTAVTGALRQPNDAIPPTFR